VDLDFGCGFGMQSPHPKMLIIPLEIMWGLDCGCGWRTRCEREEKRQPFLGPCCCVAAAAEGMMDTYL